MPGTFSLNGNAESRAYWVTYAFGTIAGTKGAGSATKGSKTTSNVTNAAKQSVQNTAKAPNVQMPYLNPFGPHHQLAPVGPVPYNVVDGVNLRDQMMMSAKNFSDGRKGSLNATGNSKPVSNMNEFFNMESGSSISDSLLKSNKKYDDNQFIVQRNTDNQYSKRGYGMHLTYYITVI